MRIGINNKIDQVIFNTAIIQQRISLCSSTISSYFFSCIFLLNQKMLKSNFTFNAFS